MSALGFVVIAIGIFMVAILFLLGMFPRGRSPHSDLEKLAEAAAKLQREQTKPAAAKAEPTSPSSPPAAPPS